MNIVRLVVISALLVFSSSLWSSTTDEVISCEGCSTSQASTSAAAVGIPNTLVYVYVVNAEDELIWRFSVFVVVEPGETLTRVRQLSVDTFAQDTFDEWMDIKNNPPVIQDYNLPGGVGIGSAWDLWGPNGSVNQLALINHMDATQNTWFGFDFGELNAIWPALGNRLIEWVIPVQPIDIKVIFPDGSSAELDWVLVTNESLKRVDASFTVSAGSSIDADGNPIPETPQEANGETWIFDTGGDNTDNLDNWETVMSFYGLGISGSYISGSHTCMSSCDVTSCTVSCTAN